MPIPAASLLPVILLPTLGGLDMDTAAKAYGDPIVFMYMGALSLRSPLRNGVCTDGWRFTF
ncbi:hypothetical protein QKW52_03685 [Bacillus sonorensis]|nr:hypothetical protein [Bacillus sonorensis]